MSGIGCHPAARKLEHREKILAQVVEDAAGHMDRWSFYLFCGKKNIKKMFFHSNGSINIYKELNLVKISEYYF